MKDVVGESIALYVPCALAAGLIVGGLAVIVAPTIRHLLFASPLLSTPVKARVQEAYIVGSFRTGLASGSGAGIGGGPKYRDLKFFIVAKYEYRGKTYTTRTTALYGEDVSLPGSPGGGTDEEYFKTAVERLRGVAPNSAYTFLQSNLSEVDRSAVKRAMAEIPEGIPQAEMDLPIVKWAPSWNYYNLPFSNGIKRGPLIFFLVSLVIGLFPCAFVVYLMRTPPGAKAYLIRSWPGWAFGALFVLLLTYSTYRSDHKPPAAKDLDETVPSSHIHRK